MLTGNGAPRLSVVTSAIGARLDAPAYAGFGEHGCAAAPPVRASDFLATRVALHRPEYAEERGLRSEGALRAEAQRVKALHK